MPIHHSGRKLRLASSITACFLLALGLYLLKYTAGAENDPEYSVGGFIVTAGGSPAPGASVVAFPVVEGGTAASLHWRAADDKGRFKLKLRRGSYEIRAKDERRGYPDPNMLLSADPSARFPVVKVEDADVEGVRVILGEQGGTLRILIRDRDTQRPIAGAKAIVRDARDARAFVELNADDHGNIQFAVAHKALTVVAQATGYSSRLRKNSI